MTSPITLGQWTPPAFYESAGRAGKSRTGQEDVQEQVGQGGSPSSVLHPMRLNRLQMLKLCPHVCVSPTSGPLLRFSLLKFDYITAVIPHFPSRMGPGLACQHQQPCAVTYLDPWPLLIMAGPPSHIYWSPPHHSAAVLFKQPISWINYLWSCVERTVYSVVILFFSITQTGWRID